MSDLLPTNPHKRTQSELDMLEEAFASRGAVFAGQSGSAHFTHAQFRESISALCSVALQRGEAYMHVNGFTFAVRASDLLNCVKMV